jgi:hypothetical protein
LKKIRNIKELLGIDIDFLYKKSIFKADLISDPNDTRNFLVFELNFKFLEIFDQFQISIFNGKALHLEFHSSDYEPDNLKKLLDLILNEYGNDENNQSSTDSLNHMSWWFKDNEHSQTYDDYENTDELYYGIMISGNNAKGIELPILSYSNIDLNFNKINWLQKYV